MPTPPRQRVTLPDGQAFDVLGPVSAEQIMAAPPGPILPDTRPNPTGINAGESTCPDCGLNWIVTPYADCFVPRCSHYTHDTTAANPNRPCESCGMKHALGCPETRGR